MPARFGAGGKLARTKPETPKGSGVRFETVEIASLRLDPRNARKHGEKNLKAIEDSLRRFGQQKPIVVLADGTVIAGNGTLEAAKRMGWTHIDIARTSLEGSEATAYGIADNRAADLAEWDNAALGALLDELEVADPELVRSIGFETGDIDRLLKRQQDDDEPAPLPTEEPKTKLGDLYLLGRHRLLCGDSTDAAAVARLMDGRTADIMVTDPPYGVEYDPSWRARGKIMRNGEMQTISKNQKKMGVVANDDRADWREAWALFNGDVAYVYHSGIKSREVQESLESCGFSLRSQIIWFKDRPAIARADYHWQHEPCFYAVRDGKSGRRTSDRTQITVWTIKARDDKGHGHGTQKPVECMAKPIRNHECELVYDPFLGSGTTIIAAERLGKTCFGLELSPAYCDAIVARWEQATGGKAELVAGQ